MTRCAVEGCKVGVAVVNGFQGHGGWLCSVHNREMKLSVANLFNRQYQNGDRGYSGTPTGSLNKCKHGKADTLTKDEIAMESIRCGAAASEV
jgi:hypothetical protein|tara:strand:- start:14455 stop:14730 length:276 start_codon:yes stop_codon:yes gene_type:complete